MKNLLIAMTLLVSPIAFAGGSSDKSVKCTCTFEVGIPGIPASYGVEKVTVTTTDDGGMMEATPYEVDNFIAGLCIDKFKAQDARKVFGHKSIKCNF